MLAAYAATVVLSHAWVAAHEPRPREVDLRRRGAAALEIPAMGDAGPLEGRRCRIAITHSRAGTAGAAGVPVVLLHGSPGSRRDMEALAGELAASGRDAIVIDLPGFGESDRAVPCYSILAHARAVIACLDELGLARVHLVAWSMGGGVALHVADLAPSRVASLALLGSIGVQEAEGSGSYAFEHAKYAVLRGLVLLVEHGVPHFGGMGDFSGARSFARNFWDSDQRPLGAILERIEAPALIVHGRDDFLVPPLAARESHARIRDSRLVMLDASHFLPWPEPLGNLSASLAEVAPFLERHDSGGAAEPRAAVDLTRERSRLGRLDLEPMSAAQLAPWWLQGLVFSAGAARWPQWARWIAAIAAAALQVDPWLAGAAIALGSACAPRAPARAIRDRTLAGLRAFGAFAGAWIALGLLAAWLHPSWPRPLAAMAGAVALAGLGEAWRRMRAPRGGGAA